jgi:hypothetical protein
MREEILPASNRRFGLTDPLEQRLINALAGKVTGKNKNK